MPENLPTLLAMAALLGASAVFSCSEAALFSLSRDQRAAMERGGDAERTAARLLTRPERLLTAILFGNLLVNMLFFALSSTLALAAEREAPGRGSGPLTALLSLGVVILVGELGPKTLGVVHARRVAGWAAWPISLLARAVDPVGPWLRGACDACARLLAPSLTPEPYLELGDVERAVELGGVGETHDGDALLVQERQVLQRLVELAETTAEEIMRPRTRCVVLRPPLTIRDLPGEARLADYILVTEPQGDEIALAAPVERLALSPSERVERIAEPVAYIPWSASAANVLAVLRERGLRVAVVLNEFGETTGIVTIEKLLDSVLRDATSIDPADAHSPRLRQLPGGAWEASGATAIRRLAKRLGLAPAHADELAEVRSVTVAGLLQELLGRPPRRGDRARFAGHDWAVSAGADPDDQRPATDDPIVVRIRATQPDAATGLDAAGGGSR